MKRRGRPARVKEEKVSTVPNVSQGNRFCRPQSFAGHQFARSRCVQCLMCCDTVLPCANEMCKQCCQRYTKTDCPIHEKSEPTPQPQVLSQEPQQHQPISDLVEGNISTRLRPRDKGEQETQQPSPELLPRKRKQSGDAATQSPTSAKRKKNVTGRRGRPVKSKTQEPTRPPNEEMVITLIPEVLPLMGSAAVDSFLQLLRFKVYQRYLESHRQVYPATMGYFCTFPSELLLNHLLPLLPVTSLLTLGASCKELHLLTKADSLWKNLYARDFPPLPPFPFLSSWEKQYKCEAIIFSEGAKKEGPGTYEDGLMVWQGEWKDGELEGMGIRKRYLTTTEMNDKEKYNEDEENIEEDEEERKAKMEMAAMLAEGVAEVWEGCFIAGKMNLDGKWINAITGQRYEGKWREDKKHGRGCMDYFDRTYEEGKEKKKRRTFVGEWRDDVREGEGKLSYGCGVTFAGIWKRDALSFNNVRRVIVQKGQSISSVEELMAHLLSL